MIRHFHAVLTVVFALLCATPAMAAPSPQLTAEQQAQIRQIQAALDALTPRTGTIAISQADATLNLGEAYYFLDAQDARRVLVDIWGNPPETAQNVLGMVFPAGASPVDDTWGAVITWVNDGYVSDADAAQLDYSVILTNMRQGETEHNRQLREQGYPASTLVGWAQEPSYNAERHNLIWAREVAFEGTDENTLNYDVRVLGRRGVLSMNIVSVMSDLTEVRTAADQLMNTAAFNSGARYTDYRQGDRTAAYGIGGLVAGGAALAVAKKAGFLGILLLILKKGWVFIIAGGAAVFGWLRNLMGGRPKTRAQATAPQPGTYEPYDPATPDPSLAPVQSAEDTPPEGGDKPL